MGTNEYAYVYDPIGNRMQSAVAVGSGQPSTTNTYAANALNQYACITNSAYSASSRETIPVYDLDGNMLTNGVWAYTWDAENRMASAVSNGVLIVTNVYDHMSRRIRKVSRGGAEAAEFLYDGWNPIREICANASCTITNYYTWGLDLSGTQQGAGGVGGLLAVTTVSSQSAQPATFYPCYDANGNIVQYLDATGGVAVVWAYDAFGGTVSETGNAVPGTVHLPHRFSTKYLDAETGLYYYGYRFYHPELGRWASRDPIEEASDLNLNGCVGNDPVNRWDRLGLMSVAPVEDSPRVKAAPNEGITDLWASAFILFDETDKQAIANAGGGTLVHGKRVTVNLRKCSPGEPIKESQVLSKRLFLSSNSIPPYRTTQPAKDGNDYIYFNLLNKKGYGNCVKGTIEVLANWHLYTKGSGSPPYGATIDDSVSGSLDDWPRHGSVAAYTGWPNVRKHKSFSSGWFNFTIRIFCGGNWEISASATPLYPKPIGRVSPNDGSERVIGTGHDGWPWMQ
jgi:RHS repeat-associated protein